VYLIVYRFCAYIDRGTGPGGDIDHVQAGLANGKAHAAARYWYVRTKTEREKGSTQKGAAS
jgi:hypothetical protein